MTRKTLCLLSLGAALAAAVLIQVENIRLGFASPIDMLGSPIWPLGTAPLVVLAAAPFGRRRPQILLLGHVVMVGLMFLGNGVSLDLVYYLLAVICGGLGALAAILALTRAD